MSPKTKILSEDEIDELVADGAIDPEDLVDRELESAALQDGINSIVSAIKSIKLQPGKQPALHIPAPQVTVNVPKRGDLTLTVTSRDRDGNILTVSIKES